MFDSPGWILTFLRDGQIWHAVARLIGERSDSATRDHDVGRLRAEVHLRHYSCSGSAHSASLNEPHSSCWRCFPHCSPRGQRYRIPFTPVSHTTNILPAGTANLAPSLRSSTDARDT